MLLLKRCRVTAPSSSASTTRTYIASTLGTQTLGRHEALNPLVPRHVVDAAGKIISPWHDIPMRVGRTDDSLHNFVCCVPRGSSATIDVSRNLPHNPLAHAMDSRSGKPSYFPFASLVNYGVLPQTFANPSRMDTKSGLMGDGALLHVCEIGEKQAASGSVYPVRILGGLATVDGGGSGNTVHWRLLAIRADDPIAGTLRGASSFTRVAAFYLTEHRVLVPLNSREFNFSTRVRRCVRCQRQATAVIRRYTRLVPYAHSECVFHAHSSSHRYTYELDYITIYA